MSKEIAKKIDDLFEETPADSYHQGYDWNGYKVYELDFNKPCFVGLPIVILVKGEEVRFSNDDESIEYLTYSNQMKAKEKGTNKLVNDKKVF